MPEITFAQAQDGLYALLGASPALAGVAISLGYPPGGPQVEQVWVAGSVPSWSREARATQHQGPGLVEDGYGLKVYVVTGKHPDFLTARSRILALAEAVITAVRADWTLGGAVSIADVEGGEVTEAVNEEGWEMGTEIRVHCRVWL